VTGGKAPSFHGLSMGEAPGFERMRGEQREGAKLPRRQTVEKTSLGASERRKGNHDPYRSFIKLK
jgi:hypothetical protein